MNTRPPIEAPNEPVVLSVSFNNDCSRFAVGLDSGFGIFQSSTCELQASKDFGGGLGLVQMMGNANYLALAGGGRSPKFPSNKVIIWDDSKGKVALEISTLTSVRGVQLSKTRVVVVLHNSGTLIRIFSTNSGAKIAERRRGAEAATVYSMRFSPSGALLACTSDRGSLHIFDVPSSRRPPSANLQPHSPGPGAPGSSSNSPADAKNKWGILSNIPFGPFQDVYSFASTKFELGDEPVLSGDNSVLGASKPMKGDQVDDPTESARTTDSSSDGSGPSFHTAGSNFSPRSAAPTALYILDPADTALLH
ncbi:hypothetical protein DL771_002597 [Monosporascus sp. 5C6A]|nr:hypothetical protein DL771_002597 [Monosporascus sp. 5C6A]